MSDAPGSGTAANREAVIQQRLATLAPLHSELIDDSARHAGHAGARGGGAHYRLLIVSLAFVGQSRLARHRMVHDALGDLMRSAIHALSVRALTPEEAASTPAANS